MKKRRYIIIGIFLVLGFLIFNKTLSELKPIPKVTFKSQNLDYDKKEPGSFKIEKSAKWIGEGKVKVTIDVDSIIKEKSRLKDILFVLDVSSSMKGDKLNQVKKDIEELVAAVLNNHNNLAALITFESDAKIVSKFTSNQYDFLKHFNQIKASGGTNYKAGLEEAMKFLKSYKKEENRDLTLLFLTDGFPGYGTPNEVAIYNELKQTFPYMSINAVQYEMGDQIKDPIKAISERQFTADMKGLNNVLFDAVFNSLSYDNFVITDYISKHFKGNIAKIKASQGDVKLEGDKVTWNLGTYRTGTKATLEIELDQVGSREEFIKTNKGIDIKTSLENKKDNQISSKTPILKGLYKVIYEANAPKGCTVKGLESNKEYRPYEKALLAQDNASCEGYVFQGYKLLTEAKHLNQDYIEMPERDVVLKATWSKINIDKSMQGQVAKDMRIYNVIEAQSLGNDKEIGIDYTKYNTPDQKEGVYLFDESKNDIFKVYYFRGTHNLNNNLIYGGFCWKIVRTTETGGTRIIYNGVPVNNKCMTTTGESTQVGISKFNQNDKHQKYVGYMYGSDDNPYLNTYDSEIKKYVDNWYKVNIKERGLESKLDKKAIYCGDRTESPSQGTYFNFKVRDRFDAGELTTKCPLNDSYSVEAGNKKLTYPVGLLTADETGFAGQYSPKSGYKYYLDSNQEYSLISPSLFIYNGRAYTIEVTEKGGLINSGPTDEIGVRPAITIKRDVLILSGTGLQNDPYII